MQEKYERKGKKRETILRLLMLERKITCMTRNVISNDILALSDPALAAQRKKKTGPRTYNNCPEREQLILRYSVIQDCFPKHGGIKRNEITI